MLKAILVDDEIASIRSLEILLSQFCKHVDVVGTARSIEEGLDLIMKQKPDVVFLDIEMPGGTGFDLLEQCIECNFEVIFISAHGNYALKAFKYSAVDFILKPIEIDELVTAVDKVTSLRRKHFDNRNKYNALFDNLKDIIPNKLVVTVNGKYEYIDLREVLYFEFLDSKVFVRFINGLSLCIDETFDVLEEQMDDKKFYRIHQSYIVNTQEVKRIEKKGEGLVLLNNGMTLPLNPLKKEGLIFKLQKDNSSLWS